MNSSYGQNLSHTVIDVCQVSKVFAGCEILKNITFSLRENESLALIGPSGCGKSTLLQLIAGLEAPENGAIKMDGSVASLPRQIVIAPHQRKLSMVFQDLGLWPNYTVRQNVELGISNRDGLSSNQREAMCLSLMDKLGISNLESRKPGKLSGGEQQRVALARAIIGKPKVLLLDEPFTGLDWLTKQAVISEIKSVIAKLQMSLILVTHNPEEAEGLCSRVLSIEHGSIVEDGLWSNVMGNPMSKILQAYAKGRRG